MFEYRWFHHKGELTELETSRLFQFLAPQNFATYQTRLEKNWPIDEIIVAQNEAAIYYEIARLSLLNHLYGY